MVCNIGLAAVDWSEYARNKCAASVVFYAQMLFSFLRCPDARIIFPRVSPKCGDSRGGVPRNRPGGLKVRVRTPIVCRGTFFMDFGLLLGCPGGHFWRLFRKFSRKDAVWQPLVAILRATFLATIFPRFRSEFFTNPRPPGGARCAFGLGRRSPNTLQSFRSALCKKSRKVTPGAPFGCLFRRLRRLFRHRCPTFQEKGLAATTFVHSGFFIDFFHGF